MAVAAAQVEEPTGDAPSADELAEAERLLDLPDDERALAEPAEEDESNYILDVALSGTAVARGRTPDTQLKFQEGSGTGVPIAPTPARCQPIPGGRWSTELLLCPRAPTTYGAATASLYLEWQPWTWLWFRSLIDTGEIRQGSTLDPPLPGITLDGQTPEDLGESALFVRELSLGVGRPGLSLELGRFRASIADGLVLDDFVGGLRGRIDFETINDSPLRAEAILAGFQRSDEEPTGGMIALRVDWDLSMFEWASVYLALVSDRGGGLSDVMGSAYAEGVANRASSTPFAGNADDALVQRILDAAFVSEAGEGGAAYAGGQLSLLPFDGVSMRATLAFMSGRLTMAGPLFDAEDGTPIEIELRGAAGDLEAHIGLDNDWDLGGHMLILTGDRPPDTLSKRYGAFIAPAPFWIWTGLFFSGGLSQGFYPSRASSAGLNGRGAIGGGPSLEYAEAGARAQLRAIWLTALADPPRAPGAGTGRNYGLEVDLELEWNPASFLRLGVEFDVLLPSDYFRYGDLAYRVLALSTVMHGN